MLDGGVGSEGPDIELLTEPAPSEDAPEGFLRETM
jgi:hypothetical protein